MTSHTASGRPLPAAPDHLSRHAWSVLALTMTFLLADGYDAFILLVTGQPTLHELLPASRLPHLHAYLGYLIAVTLAGWATGSVVGGVLGDRLGRRRTMVYAVVIYSVFTGLSAATGTWWLFGLTRFFTGLGIGAEWGAGTSLFQEIWPQRWRTKGAGLMQSAFAFGGLLVSGLWVLLGSTYGLSWRWMYLFGILPLVVVIFFWRHIPESGRWVAARRSGVGLRDVLCGRSRRNFVAAAFVSIAIMVGWWAVSSFLPTYVGGLVKDPGRTTFFTGWAGALFNIGQIFGCAALGFLSDVLGRKITVQLYFAGCLVIVPIVFLGVHGAAAATWLQLVAGFLTGGVYSWYAVHTPELFPTAVRATAISAIFGGARYLAMVGAVLTGTLASSVGGFGHAAAIVTPIYLVGIVAVFFLPETRGRPLPE
ncbi:MAG: MFS transporter [Actinoallomurus sp.]